MRAVKFKLIHRIDDLPAKTRAASAGFVKYKAVTQNRLPMFLGFFVNSEARVRTKVRTFPGCCAICHLGSGTSAPITDGAILTAGVEIR